MRRRRSGFTFVELLTVMALIGLLVRIAVPHYVGLKKKALAASIFGDVHAVHLAAMHYYATNQSFPADSPAGTVPPELVNDLPNNFSFVQTDWVYDWHTWNDGPQRLVGLSVSSGDADLINQLFKLGGPGFIPIAGAGQVTFLLSSH